MNRCRRLLWIAGLCVLCALLGLGCPNPLTTVGLGDDVDILPPGIKITPTPEVDNGAYIRGTVTVSGSSSDDVSVASVTWSFTDTASGLTSTPETASLDESRTTWSFLLDTTQPGALYADGEKDFVVTVTDDSEKTTDTRILLIFDNSAPQAGFVSPATGSVVYNLTTLRGSSSDNTRLSKVELRIGKLGTGSGDGFFEITGSLYDWSKEFLSNDYANATQATDLGGDVWELPIYCRVYDVAGNVATNEPSDTMDPLYPAALVAAYGSAVVFDPLKVPDFHLVIDLDRDKPTITIQTPQDDSNTAGTVAVSGTCFDESPGMDKVEIQIAALEDDETLIGYLSPTGDAVAPAASWLVVPWTGGQRSFWQQNLNENERLYDVGAAGGAYPGSNHNGKLRVNVRPTDLGGKVGVEQTVSFRLDNSIPRLENPQFEINGVDTLAYDYLYVGGTIRLKAKVRDDQAVTSIRLSLDGGSSYGSNLIGSGYVIQNAINDFDIDYPIDTLTDPQIPLALRTAKNGLLTVAVKVQDNATPAPYVSTWLVSLNMDNLYPTAAYTGTSGNGHDPMMLSGNMTSTSQIMGTSTDFGTVSGIELVEVYLARNGGAKVIDLSTGALLDAESASFGDPPAAAPYTTNAACKAAIDWTKVGAIDNMALVQNGADVDWWVKLDTTVIPDGDLDIHYVVWDRAGNAVHGLEGGFIRNKVPVISSVSVGTDLDASGAVDAGEISTYNPLAPITARNNRLYIRINTTETGYNTPFSYSIQYSGVPADPTNYSDSSGVAVINSAGKFGGDGVGKVFTVSITDNVGISVQQDVTVDILNNDTQDPTITINPISAPADLVDWNAVQQPGHIEAIGISTYDNGGTADADVSGTVVVRGSAYDNVLIDTISLSIDGGAPFQAAHWNGAALIPDVADFHIAAETLNDSGHSITWAYKWNTAGIATVAKNDVVLSLVANDLSANPSAPGIRQYDVVPYITQVDTAVTGYISKDFNRSALGRYPVRTGETVTVHGYNLDPVTTGVAAGASDVRIVSSADRDSTSKSGRGLAFGGVGSPYTSITATVSTLATDPSIGSGYLVVWVNGVPSINARSGRSNVETNFVSASGTDERRLTIWDLTVFKTDVPAAPSADHAVYPSMALNGNTPVFAYVNNAQGYGLAEYWDGTNEIKIYENWDLFTYTSLTLNADNSRAALYDINIVRGGVDYVGDKGGILSSFFYQPPNTTWNGTTYYFRDYNIWLDNLYKSAYPAVLGRYQYPDLKTVGGNTITTVFYSVYDTIDDRVLFRSFKVGTSSAAVGSSNAITDNGTNIVYTDIGQYNQNNTWPTYTDNGTNNTRFASNNNSGKTPGGTYTIDTGSGPWTAAAGTSGGVALVVWYDTNTNELKYAYNTAPSVAGGGTFTGTQVLDSFCGGDFVDMVVDSADHIHIAYHDSFSGDLEYVYIDSYNSSPLGPYKVDAYLTIGNKAGIAVDDSGIPYVTFKGMGNTAKAAWLVGARGDGVNGSEKFNGTWEVQVLPARIVDNDTNRFSIGVGTNGLPVVGYTNDGLEYIRRLADLP